MAISEIHSDYNGFGVSCNGSCDGFIDIFNEAGGTVLANACGPCIGQWNRHDVPKESKNSIITSYNRNFAKRNDGNINTHAFVSSPELVTVCALSGRLDFDPANDTIKTPDGKDFKFEEPFGKGALLIQLARPHKIKDWGQRQHKEAHDECNPV